jgi:hypothetical protein
MSLLEGHPVPTEFKEGDRVRISASSDIPYEPYEEGAGHRGYFTVTHIPTGKTLAVWHQSDKWMLEGK